VPPMTAMRPRITSAIGLSKFIIVYLTHAAGM
jgi:hypothetical protein